MMREVVISRAGDIAPDAYTELAGALRTRRTLADVLAWARRQTPPRTVTEIITQDEYTHDVVIGFGDRCYLVFDTT
jgi:hypothetical protein